MKLFALIASCGCCFPRQRWRLCLIGTKPTFVGPWLVLALAGIQWHVVQLTVIKKDDSPPFWGLAEAVFRSWRVCTENPGCQHWEKSGNQPTGYKLFKVHRARPGAFGNNTGIETGYKSGYKSGCGYWLNPYGFAYRRALRTTRTRRRVPVPGDR